MWLIIDDKDENGILGVGLSQLLAVIGGDLGYQWSILEMEARAESLVLGRRVLDLEEEAFNSPTGLLLSWSDVVDLARGVTEFIDLTIVACRAAKDIPRTLEDRALERCEITLQLVDSDRWRIYLRDLDLARRFRSAFPRAKVRQRKEKN